MSVERSLGAFIGNTTAFFPTSARASGVYSLAEQNLFLQERRWPRSTNVPVEVLVVAGGGGGGGWGGGGGAGGLIYEKQFDLFSGINYSITVGGGGARGTEAYTGGGSGSNSILGPLVAIGGGGGGWYNSNNGLNGGSGGGGGGGEGTTPGCSSNGGSGTTNQGFAGGCGGRRPSNVYYMGGGGGGGAGGTGGSSFDTQNTGCIARGADGGIGVGINITGQIRFYAGGGGGHTPGESGYCGNGLTSRGGLGGGGDGGNYYGSCDYSSAGNPANIRPTFHAKSGEPNTGGGGGGSQGGPCTRCGAGGSGIIVLKVPSTYIARFSGGVNYTASTAEGFTTYIVTGTSTVSETVRFELATLTENVFVSSGPQSIVDFYLWGAGGGSGSQQRTGTVYWTYNQFFVKEGGAGGFVAATYSFTPGTVLLLSVGGLGRGGLIQGAGTRASGGYNGGAQGGVSTNDQSGGGGGYTGVFLNSIGKNANGAILISPGGGGGGGGPGYPGNNWDKACGGGGIGGSDGAGNPGASPFSIDGGRAGPGLMRYGGNGGQGGQNQVGDTGSLLAGGAGYNGSSWGAGGGGGGGWTGGGGGAGDGSAWSGGGGGSGSAFARGSGLINGIIPEGDYILPGVRLVSYSFGIQQFGRWGNGTKQGDYDSMRMPVGTTVPQYPGGNVGYGGAFNTTPAQGLDGSHGAIVYRINNGPWQTVSYTGSDITITV